MWAADSTRTTSTAGGDGAVDGRDKDDCCALAGALRGERGALLARRAVADEADRVDRLPGASGGDDDPTSGEATTSCQQGSGGLDDRIGLGEAAGADVSAGERSLDWIEDLDSTGPQHLDVVLGRRVLPHLGVHRRADEDRAPAHQ